MFPGPPAAFHTSIGMPGPSFPGPSAAVLGTMGPDAATPRRSVKARQPVAPAPHPPPAALYRNSRGDGRASLADAPPAPPALTRMLSEQSSEQLDLYKITHPDEGTPGGGHEKARDVLARAAEAARSGRITEKDKLDVQMALLQESTDEARSRLDQLLRTPPAVGSTAGGGRGGGVGGGGEGGGSSGSAATLAPLAPVVSLTPGGGSGATGGSTSDAALEPPAPSPASIRRTLSTQSASALELYTAMHGDADATQAEGYLVDVAGAAASGGITDDQKNRVRPSHIFHLVAPSDHHDHFRTQTCSDAQLSR